MTYEEFRESIVRFSKNIECILSISLDNKENYDFRANESGMYSSLWHNPLNDGFVSWKEIETMLEKGEWENYPNGKRTIMRMGNSEYFISVYFLTDIN